MLGLLASLFTSLFVSLFIRSSKILIAFANAF